MCALQVLLCSYRCQGGVLKQGSAILGGGLKSAQGAQFAPSFLSSRFYMVLWHLQVLSTVELEKAVLNTKRALGEVAGLPE